VDAIALLRMESEWAHQEFDMTTADVTPEVAHQPPLAAAGSVASSMAHAIVGEDLIIQGMLQGKPPLHATTYQGMTGISDPQFMNAPDWVKSVRIDIGLFRAYSAAVGAATDAYIESLTESDLDLTHDFTAFGMGIRPRGWALTALVIGHLHDLTGEISAIKDSHGLKGYPF
jgi:hypothetical protein